MSKEKTLEAYLERRVRELIRSGLSDAEVIEQLTVVKGRKAVTAEAAKQKLASTTTH
jgi:hypothetical protein